MGFRFPPDYRAFLAQNGGGEGFIGIDQGYASLASPAELIEMHDGYKVGTFYEGLVLTGSNGGGEAFGIDPVSGRFVSTPFIGDEPDTRIDAGSTIAEFLAFIQRGSPVV